MKVTIARFSPIGGGKDFWRVLSSSSADVLLVTKKRGLFKILQYSELELDPIQYVTMRSLMALDSVTNPESPYQSLLVTFFRSGEEFSNHIRRQPTDYSDDTNRNI